jgi:hypothetical protein
MNDSQRKLVVLTLILLGLALAVLMLHWSNLPFADKVIVFYGTSGIYTWYGMTGIVFGVVVPFCLFFVAACIALGVKGRG